MGNNITLYDWLGLVTTLGGPSAMQDSILYDPSRPPPPQLETWETWIPVYGAIRGMDYAFYNGHYVQGTFDLGMAVADMAFIKSSDKQLIGRGAGLKDEQLETKRNVIRHALMDYDLFHQEPFEVLSCVGGLDIAAMTGLYLGAAYYRIPVVIDGLISAAAALAAYNINNKTATFMFTSHLSEEPAYLKAVQALGLEPMLNLHMRLGEGSGCPVAMQIIQNACDIMNNMQTFQDINLEEEYRKDIKMS